jgi:hypothetical protein
MDGKQRAMISQEGSPRTKVNTASRLLNQARNCRVLLHVV